MKAFILAAGFGKRLRPHTATKPKPLVEVAGTSLLKRTLLQLKDVQIDDIVINHHYLGDQIVEHLKNWHHQTITFSEEEKLLDTGGGIVKMINHFREEPFIVCSGDGFLDDGSDFYTRLISAWNPQRMDILISLQPVSTMSLTNGSGDYNLDKNGLARRAKNKDGAYMFTSMRINHPRVFDGYTKDEPFSYLECLDRAEQEGRLYGIIHEGDWHHISTPQDLENVCNAYGDKHTSQATS